MKARLVWVIGGGGLLGSHLIDRFSESGDVTLWPGPGRLFSWTDRGRLFPEIDAAVSAFADLLSRDEFSSWAMVWAAGAGIVTTGVAELEAETDTLRHFLERLGQSLASNPGTGSDRVRRAGCVFLASSAGGVYAGCADSPATESSPLLPLSEYGRQKIRQERLLADWAEAQAVSHVIGRISNLYGPGQNLRKPQGLVSHLARSLILNHPVRVYVPLDTVRDYIHADDCARAIVTTLALVLRRGDQPEGPRALVKIFASEQPVCIAVLLGIFSRIARRRPRIIQASRPEARLQPRQLCFRSRVWPEASRPRIGLLTGVMQTYQELLRRYHLGQLAEGARARAS